MDERYGSNVSLSLESACHNFKAFRYSNIDLELVKGDRIIIQFPVEYKDVNDMEDIKVEVQTIIILTMISANKTELMNLWVLSCSQSDF